MREVIKNLLKPKNFVFRKQLKFAKSLEEAHQV